MQTHGHRLLTMKEFIAYIIKNLVDEPESVNVEETDQEGLITLLVRVAKEDIGKVVGRGGKTIKSVRTIASLAANRIDRKVRIEVVDA